MSGKRFMYWCLGLLLVVSLPGLAFAQITVSGSAWADPSSLWGRMKTWYEMSGPFTIPIGATGGPQVWDVSGLTGDEWEYIETYEDPSGKPFAEFFPDANLCVDGEEPVYLRASPSGLELLGDVEEGDYFVYTPPLLLFKWPLTFGTSWTTSTTIGEEEFTFEVVVDAWGTVKVPAGTFECLRVRHHRTIVSLSEIVEEVYFLSWIREDGEVVADLETDEWREDPNFSVTEWVDVLKSVTGGVTAVSGSSWGVIKSLFR